MRISKLTIGGPTVTLTLLFFCFLYQFQWDWYWYLIAAVSSVKLTYGR